MSKLPWKPWHEVVQLRDDLKSGELSLAVFAADLYEVAMGRARSVYREPGEFFALTYPTFNLRELAKDVVNRLAGKNDKAVRQLELTYGGGKTHTLITLFHLVQEPDRLPKLPTVDEFIQHIGERPPKARVVVLPFDKLDVEKGMEIRSPDGQARWLKNPWSVIAFQIAGSEGLKLLHPENQDAERGSAPAENLMVELLALPGRDGLSTLLLIDEVLMYAREKIGFDPAWRARLVNFFQYLTQAATKVDRCAVVASLLATDPRKGDTLGKEITQELYAIFRREREEGVQPVVKDDVAEVLRRRFFKPESIRDREAFRPHVVAALKGVADLDEQSRREGKAAEDKFLHSYPFHPELTEVFYGKWTALEGFQRTRGILRTLALALRDAERWDQSPLVGASTFLGEPGKTTISEATRELATVAGTEEYEGRRQDWTAILEGELQKAREIQAEFPGLKFREIEGAVFATFLHSQPIGHEAQLRDLMLLLGATRPDKIEIEKGLLAWSAKSWFLDDAAINQAGDGKLPQVWRLGSRPNLQQMHHDALRWISEDLVNARLLDEIGKLKSLTAGASGAGARVHNLPDRPRDIEDDGEFHYAVVGPKAASESGKPNPEAKRFLEETTAPDRPRVYRNAVVLAAPSRDGLDIARGRIADYLGWEEVRTKLKDQDVDPVREQRLSMNIEASRKRIPEAIQQTYCIVVTVSDKGEVQAFKIATGEKPLFSLIKEDARSRIQETAVSAEALLPDGPYNLWRDGETSRRVKDLVGAFAQFPHLPKMLNRQAIVDTLVLGCKEGQFVLRSTRPDRSVRTFWRQEPSEADLKDPSIEVVLPQAAELTELSPSLMASGTLPGLWTVPEIPFHAVLSYFAGGKVVKVPREGYEESITIPKADRVTVETALGAAVHDGKLWMTSGLASILGEEIPTGLLTDDAVLQSPPGHIPTSDVLPSSLPEAWHDGSSTALSIVTALSKKAGRNLPWTIVREVLDGAFRAGLLERSVDSGAWPCDFAGAQFIKLRIPQAAPPPPPPPPKPGLLVAEAELRPNEIQDLADQIAEIAKIAAGFELRFRLRVELSTGQKSANDLVDRLNALLAEISTKLRLR